MVFHQRSIKRVFNLVLKRERIFIHMILFNANSRTVVQYDRALKFGGKRRQRRVAVISANAASANP